jgi:transposase
MEITLRDVRVTHIAENEDRIIVKAEVVVKPGVCPRCQPPTSQVHQRRVQRVRDLPKGPRPLVGALTRPHLVCVNPQCPVKTFRPSATIVTSKSARECQPAVSSENLPPNGARAGAAAAPRSLSAVAGQ